MGGQGSFLRSQVSAYVDLVRQFASIQVRGREPGLGDQPGHSRYEAQHVRGPAQPISIDGRFQHHPGAGELCGQDADPVHLHMVRVSVATDLVVHGQHVGLFGKQDLGKLLGRADRVQQRERHRLARSLHRHRS